MGLLDLHGTLKILFAAYLKQQHFGFKVMFNPYHMM
jgi:hypothetical protein